MTTLILAAALAAAPAQMSLRSESFPDGSPIPAKFTCTGKDVSPALQWSNLPAGTKSLAVIATDRDAKNFTHWVLYGIPANRDALSEGASQAGLPVGAQEGINDFKLPAWKGPCPP